MVGMLDLIFLVKNSETILIVVEKVQKIHSIKKIVKQYFAQLRRKGWGKCLLALCRK
jgi:hypothetical protein